MTPGELADRLDMQWFPDAVSAAAMLRELAAENERLRALVRSDTGRCIDAACPEQPTHHGHAWNAP